MLKQQWNQKYLTSNRAKDNAKTLKMPLSSLIDRIILWWNIWLIIKLALTENEETRKAL